MILTAPVRSQWRDVIPSVVHEDQSARIQTVAQSTSPKYYRLLNEFKKLTGISVLLNTSFNRKGMPIFETPEHAIEFFLSCELDALVLGNHIVLKRPPGVTCEFVTVTDRFIECLRRTLESNSATANMIRGTFQINVAGVRSFMIDLSGPKPAIVEGTPAIGPLAAIDVAETDLQAFWRDPQAEGLRLYQAGKVRIEGSVSDAIMLLSSLRLA
jgi:hypothetical protein